MGVEIRNIGDPVLETELVDALRSSGFDPEQRSDVIVLRGVGHHEGDRSVDMEIDLIEMDSFRVLQFLIVELVLDASSDASEAQEDQTSGRSAASGFL